MPRFKVGDYVRWVRALSSPEYTHAEGIVTADIESEAKVDDFTMYDVKFTFGSFTLYGTQIDQSKTQPKQI